MDYWDELCRIMKWSTTNVHSTLHICWGAQAGIFYHYGIQKHELPKKLSGVFNHDVLKPSSPLVRGFDDEFWAPHSRHTTVDAADIEADPAPWRSWRSPTRPVSTSRRASTAATSSCSATPSTTPTRCATSTTAT